MQKRITLFLIAFLLMATSVFAAETEYDIPLNLWKGLIGEAVSDGYIGMEAVACCVRNRLDKNMSIGLVALKRGRLNGFVRRQGKKYEIMAKDIVQKVFYENSPDITGGATNYENVKVFGYPKWARDMILTEKIGDHWFFKEKEKLKCLPPMN